MCGGQAGRARADNGDALALRLTEGDILKLAEEMADCVDRVAFPLLAERLDGIGHGLSIGPAVGLGAKSFGYNACSRGFFL